MVVLKVGCEVAVVVVVIVIVWRLCLGFASGSGGGFSLLAHTTYSHVAIFDRTTLYNLAFLANDCLIFASVHPLLPICACARAVASLPLRAYVAVQSCDDTSAHARASRGYSQT